ncbi:MAG: hypothetical protein VYD64_06890 [Pseudomonadota bacterium]|nr:hypothetical protein [Pseudomonadota bacterium]
MSDLDHALRSAAAEGIISEEQHANLVRHFAERGLLAQADGKPAEGLFAELSQPRDAEPPTPAEESEAPRFVRGFHDILITIGVIAALAGLGGLGSVWLMLPAIIVLAEILVKRQRLALPAFALTIAYSSSVLTLALMLLEGWHEQSGPLLAGTLLVLAQPLFLLPYYWRYRVPVALALTIMGGFALALMLIVSLLAAMLGTDNPLVTHPLIVKLLALAAAAGLFVLAMAFDMRDRHRVTRRSDVAFWLHLGVAPALMWSVFALTMGDAGESIWWAGDPGAREALTAVVVIAAMMLVGIVIDRRAFVTSGLISLGVALAVLARQTEIEYGQLTAIAVLSVGLIVLVLGTGWLVLRRRLLTLLPERLRDTLPPSD